jgi:hypothetical protein
LAVGLLAPLLAHKRLHALAGAVTLLADKVGYGLGGSTNGGVFGHGGDCATNMTIDSNRGLIIVLMVQHAGFPKDGNKSLAAFQKAARERFGSSGKEVALFGKNRCNQSCEGLNSANSSTPMPRERPSGKNQLINVLIGGVIHPVSLLTHYINKVCSRGRVAGMQSYSALERAS